ncbi:MAG: Na+/H+ antiporter NhaC family protein [Desulfobacteraceae bacterium]|nr:Na+/H+ antiporter NhaC family protein [Desulfobacteraceae bacterium]
MEEIQAGKRVEMRFTPNMAFLPIAIFIFFCIELFIVKKAFDMVGLAMGGFLGLIVGTFFARDWKKYWQAIMDGVASPMNGTLIMILFVVGIFSALMKSTGVAQGFVWLGYNIGMDGGLFTAFAFLAACAISTATGTSIGTLFTAIPILYPSGVLLGADPAFLAGAILSGAIFGDNLAPVSDTTIVSAATQTYQNKEGHAEVGGVVSSRFKYAIVAAGAAALLFLVFGGGGEAAGGGGDILQKNMNPKGLIMLVPVAILLWIAIKTREIFTALIWGTVIGTAFALIFGIFSLDTIFNVKDGNIGGFVFDGINGMVGTVTLCISLFGVIGLLEKSGAMTRLIDSLVNSRLAATPMGAELVMCVGVILASMAFGAATGPSLIMFGPIGNKIGSAQKLHPYRRANILDGFGNTLPIVMPFSAFVFIVMGVVSGQNFDFLPKGAVNPVSLFYATLHPWMLFIVFMISVLTGWGRLYEGQNGEVIRSRANEIPSNAE